MTTHAHRPHALARTAATLALGGGLALAAAGSAQAAAGLTLSPGGPYTSGQSVTVKGSGFLPNHQLFVVHCDPAVPSGGACDMGAFKQATTDANGAFTATVVVNAKFGSTDCNTVQCAVMTSSVTNPRDRSQEGRANTSFGSGGGGAAAPAAPAAPGASKPAASTNKTYPKAAATGAVDSSGGAQSAALAGLGIALAAGALVARRRLGSRTH